MQRQRVTQTYALGGSSEWEGSFVFHWWWVKTSDTFFSNAAPVKTVLASWTPGFIA